MDIRRPGLGYYGKIQRGGAMRRRPVVKSRKIALTVLLSVFPVLNLDPDVLGHFLDILHGLANARSSCLVAFVVELRKVIFKCVYKAFQVGKSAHFFSSLGDTMAQRGVHYLVIDGVQSKPNRCMSQEKSAFQV